MANPEDLGHYRLKRLLGRGALGQVWEATERDQPGTKVAVKIMHAADEELTMARVQFAREARLAALLRHPHVAAVLDAGEAAGTSFMVMEMVEGTPLRRLIGDASVPMNERLRWLRQIGDGLAALHAAGIAHRDLKPENVIIRPERTACLVDLGIAKWKKFDLGGELDPEDFGALEAPPPSQSAAARYAPPETEASSIYDELGDQYAWGVIAYELITGTFPSDDAPPLTEQEGVAAPVVSAIERARSTRREQRWPAMEKLLDELALAPASQASRLSKGQKPSASSVTTLAPDAPDAPDVKEGQPAAPKPVVIAGVLAVLLVLMALVVAGLQR